MTVATIAEFRSLASQLTDTVTQSFIDKPAVAHSKLILDSLSTYFIHQSTIKKFYAADSHNAKCIECISKIIQYRVTDDVSLQELDPRRFPLNFLELLTSQQGICDRIRSLAGSAASTSITSMVAFKNIEYLKVYHVKYISNSDAQTVASAFGKFRGFELDEYWDNVDDGKGHLLLKALGQRLQYLRLRRMDNRDNDIMENI